MAPHLTFLQDITVPGTMQERLDKKWQQRRVCRPRKRAEYAAVPAGQGRGGKRKVNEDGQRKTLRKDAS